MTGNPPVAPEAPSATSNARTQAQQILEEAFTEPEALPEEPEAQETEQEAISEEPEAQEAEQEPEASEEAPEAPEEGEAPEVRTIKDLATALEVSPEYLYGLEMPVVGGEPVKLGEIKDRLQEAIRITAQGDKLAEDRTSLDKQRQEWTQQQQQIRDQILQAPAEALAARAQMMSIEQDWKLLEGSEDKYNPGELALHRQKLQEAYQGAQQREGAALQQQRQQQQKQHIGMVQAEAGKLLEAIPEWKDAAAAKTGRDRISGLLKDYGFETNAIDSVYDSRIIRMLSEFAQMKEELGQAKELANRGLRPPRVLKPGAVRSARTVKKQKIENVMAKAQKTTNLRAKASAITQMLGGT